MKLIYLSEGLRMFFRRIKILFIGIKRYSGDEELVCKQIIESCFNSEKKYFQVSSGHFCEFYCRDFGFCSRSLIELGYKKQVDCTLEYALNIFKKNKRVTQSISPQGISFNFPEAYSPDALVYLVHALKNSGNKYLLNKYKSFIKREVKYFFKIVIDEKTGRIRENIHFGSMKDHSIRSGSCYDTCMAGLLKNDLSSLGLYNPFEKYDYEKILLNDYWDGSFFHEDVKRCGEIFGDANLFPFWCGIISDETILKKVIASIELVKLDMPFPLKYSAKITKNKAFIFYDKIAGGYEHDAIWAHMGPLYIDVLSRINKKKAMVQLKKYSKEIRRYGNFLEVYACDGSAFSTPYYYSDESMLWCANYLALKKKLV